MKVTRRSMLQRIVRVGATALTMAGAIAAGHTLFRRGRRGYPANALTGSEAGALTGIEHTPTTPHRTSAPFEVTRLIRPPGALAEEPFLAGCIRCYRCQDACEPGAIQFFTEADGKHYHTPYIDPAIKGCTLSMKCTQVCPTGVLKPMEVKQKAEADMATVELRQDMCLSFKAKRIRDEQSLLMELGREATDSLAPYERRGPCGECYMFCPLRGKAIKLEPGAFLAPIVYVDHCVGCGMCEEICRVMVRGEPAIRVVPTRVCT
ncbi:MAG: 4Fe-4S dicluster domain-containing protein [bacterium]|nr:4Fe-4S dicluster domain-containing protein [bacterium]